MYDPLHQDRGAQQQSVKGSSFRQIKVRGLQQEEAFGSYGSPQQEGMYGAFGSPQQAGMYGALTENDLELRTEPIVSTR
jgi:hypothetical protein